MENFESKFKLIAEECLNNKKKGEFILRNGDVVLSNNLQYNLDQNGNVYIHRPYILNLKNGIQVFLDIRGKEVLHEAPYDIIDFYEK